MWRREWKQTVKIGVIRSVVGVAVTTGVVALFALPVHAVTYGGGSVQGYSADAPLDTGTIVQLAGKDANRVKIAMQSELQNMFGVVVDRNQLSMTITNEALQNETFVAASGTYNVLVSTQGGAINTGDYVTLSAVNGVAMKAGTEEKTIFGRANGSFDGKGVTLGTTKLKDTTGKENKTVTLGSIPVTIDIKNNPNEKSTKVQVPEALERIGQAIAEKEVSAIRIYISMAITVISIIASIAILYSGIRSAIISIGRNPMSKKSIFRALLEIILTSILTLIIGLFAVYLLLKL
ncbi:hypothetical protein A2707_03835 [Candidatus Saccharibacteria bacterium RIFCSPHIGHO2_01_FULL_45_15]|nr:MAG: hypothetical protein A2707_03835 [Candidatus Saccharibacteria bacterium RIFCSPHIGHO2_01_FULL_45_15]OGL27217.1 MAG: hypothetical protein A3C39_04015 [Candidatus Saccharibacteria bacterium RIFCSPHIGHO2_02_FULL_46_12]OGL31514.1 MAG: hypothetical protein A3E76_03840 [Candidatus Saccharibacteria bacterium RIFCSPHIGHO2_12_FULL_44_22]